jgi:hypothetical protein
MSIDEAYAVEPLSWAEYVKKSMKFINITVNMTEFQRLEKSSADIVIYLL